MEHTTTGSGPDAGRARGSEAVSGQLMRAAVSRQYGRPEVVRVERVPRPRVRPDDVLVRVHASDVSVADHRLRARDLPRGMGVLAAPVLGIRAPRRPVLGMEVAGLVEEVGARVTAFRPGDRVVAATGREFGGHAEYARVPAGGTVAHVPEGMSFEDAVALVFGGITAVPYLRRARLRPGDEVLVNGASGAVGVMTVQLAKHQGAHVTAVCSARNADLVRDLGADVVVDHETEDFVAPGRTYDVVVDCVGNAGFARVRPVIRRGGSLLLVIADLAGMVGAPLHQARGGIRVVTGNLSATGEDLAHLLRLASDGVLRPVVDRTYDLDDVVEAHRYVDTGRKRGAVVLRVGG